MDYKQTRRGGFYWINGKPYVTVTSVLKIIDKPALLRWAARETYYAMVKDPGIDESTAVNACFAKSKDSITRGLTIHDIVENHKTLGENINDVPGALQPYILAFYRFLKEHKVTILENETSITSKRYGYMGTCDILCKMGESDDVYVLDVKTGKQIYDEVELQLSAYKQGLNENGIKCDRMGVILLETGADNKPTGEYIFATKSYNFETFLACKKVWEWQNESLCHKVEYETGKY